MEIISLKIRTKDPQYGDVLQTVLRRNYPGFLISLEPIGPEACGSEERETEAAGGTGWGIDLSLCDDREALRDAEVLLVDLPALETVRQDGTVTAGEGPVCLFKYAPAHEMIGKILSLCAERLHRPIYYDADSRCRIVGVFSGAGGKGCTAVSLALAQYGARLRGNCPLIVPFGQFPRGGACAAAGGLPLREFVFRALKDKDLKPDPDLLRRAVSQDAFGVGRFAVPQGENPLYRLSGEAMQTVLRALAMSGYDTLVLDIGTVVNEAAFAAFRAADRLVMLTDDTAADSILQEYLRTKCGGGVLEKIIPVRSKTENPELSAIDRFYEDSEEPEVTPLSIPYEPLLPAAQHSRQGIVFPLEGGFTDAVEELLTVLDSDVPAALCAA